MTRTLGRSYQELLDTMGAYCHFPLAISRDGEQGDGTLALSLQPLGGVVDQAGGLVFALRDIGNYFVFRVNALEDNAILFEFVNDKRIERARAHFVITRDRWHALEVVVTGTKASCSVDGSFVFDYQAGRLLHGHVGLWTKADSVTRFHSLTIDDPGRSMPVSAGNRRTAAESSGSYREP
ncbi:MAG: hypothetical protein V1793_05930 [Pseudomonadota bacterium]